MPERPIVADGASGRLLPNEPEAWQAALFDLAGNREATRRLAAGGQHLSATIGDRGRVRDFWRHQLGLT